LFGAAAVGVTASQQGAYFPPAWGWSAFGLLLTAALALAFRPRIEINRFEWALLAGLTSLLLWTALSAAWSDSLPRTIAELERTMIYVAAIAALIALVSAETLGYMLGGLLAAVVAIAVYALVDQPANTQGNPLSGPLGYWNAVGLLMTIGLLLALALASAQLPRSVRLAAAAAVPLLAATLYLTRSRGALLGLAAGFVLFAFRHPFLSGRQRRIAAFSVAALVIAALGVGTVHAGGPSALIERTYNAFRSPPSPHGERSERLLTVSGNFRSHYWHVAWIEYRAHPWLGCGAGTFELYWDRYRKTIYGSRDAHNLYLETLAELGPMGLALLVATFAIPFVALRRTQREPLVGAAAGGFLAFLVQAAVDWDWEMPAVTLAGLLCGGAVVVGASSRGRSVSSTTRWAALAALSVLAAFTAVAWRGNSAADASVEAAARGHYSKAVGEARTATRWTPWASEPWRLLGEADLALGERRRARKDVGTAISKDPHDWKLWYDLALASSGAARTRALARAAVLNPYSTEVRALRNK
jgi:O-antigen ligase